MALSEPHTNHHSSYFHNKSLKRQGLIQVGTARLNIKDFRRLPGVTAFSADLSIRSMVLGSTQALRAMSTRNLPSGKERPARKADLTTICVPILWEDVRTFTSDITIGLHDLLFYLLLYA
jgi:hypothetical protein